MATAKIAVLPGDGIGTEVTAEALRVLSKVGSLRGHTFETEEALIGGAAIDASGNPLPEATVALCKSADAVLLGAVGGPKWSDPTASVRPEQGLLGIRKALGLFTNLRPVKPHPQLSASSPLKPELVAGVDMMVVRELTGGIYFGDKTRQDDVATDLCRYSKEEVVRVVRVAAQLAQKRRGKLMMVDKANVLETSRLWREVSAKLIADEFSELDYDVMLVDACAMRLISAPASFDVVVTENMFGDILTDEASVLAGSLGMLPSASLSGGKRGLYEPVHGSAPDIAGQGKANPFATILSVAMLLEHSLDLGEEAVAIDAAVGDAIAAGTFTADLGESPSGKNASTVEATDAVLKALDARLS